MTAKDSLAHTLNAVGALNDQLSNLKSEYAYFKQLAKEASEMAQEEILSIRCVSLSTNVFIFLRHNFVNNTIHLFPLLRCVISLSRFPS
jgi:hypothetical protein